MGRWKLLEITVQPSMEHFTVCNLCFMALAGFKFNFALQVDVAAGKKSEFDVLVNGSYVKTKFRMLHNDLIGGMTLPDQRGDDLINVMKLLL